MAEFTRTILARLRQYVGDRRRSKRQRVRLSFSLSLSAAAQSLNGARRIKTLDGHTLDISDNGLALIVPQITLAEHHLVGENRSLDVKLQVHLVVLLWNTGSCNQPIKFFFRPRRH